MGAVVERIKEKYQQFYQEKYGRTDSSITASTPRFVDFDELAVSRWGDRKVCLITRDNNPDLFAVDFDSEESAEEQYLLIAGVEDYLGIESLDTVQLDQTNIDESLRVDRDYVRDKNGRFAHVASSGAKVVPANKPKTEAPQRITTKTNIAQLRAITIKHGIAAPTKNAHRRASWHEAIKGHDEGAKYFEGGKKAATTGKGGKTAPDPKAKGTKKPAKKPEQTPEEKQAAADKAEFESLLSSVNKSDHKQVIRLGELFAKQYLKTSTSAPQDEKDLFTKRKVIKEIRDNMSKQYGKDSPEYQMHHNSFQEADQALKAVRQPRHEAIAKEHEVLRKALMDHHGLASDEAEALVSRTKYNASIDAESAQKVKQIQAEVYQLTGGKGSESLKEMVNEKPRAFANQPRGVINIGQPVKDTDIAHEMGHHMEYNNAALKQAANDWIRSRATSQTPEKLSTLTGNVKYPDKEVALPDKFLSHYVGKVYKSGNTEVYSMGLERFHTADAMRKFHLDDPEHYHLVLGALLSK